ncbi:MAG: hypothetical protein PHF94_08100 [Methanothrix sp.]|nr:hypothetical protein [Methanothrix sp.]
MMHRAKKTEKGRGRSAFRPGESIFEANRLEASKASERYLYGCSGPLCNYNLSNMPIYPNSRSDTAYGSEIIQLAANPKPSKEPVPKRPKFSTQTYNNAIAVAKLGGTDLGGKSLQSADMALPHRMSWKDLRDNVVKLTIGLDSEASFMRWTNRLVFATEERIKSYISGGLDQQNLDSIRRKLNEFKTARGQFLQCLDTRAQELSSGKDDPGTLKLLEASKTKFLALINQIPGNVPDIGPHKRFNNPVRERAHLHAESGSLTPASLATASMTPGRLSKGIATTSDKEHLVTTDGTIVPISSLPPDQQQKIKSHSRSSVPRF